MLSAMYRFIAVSMFSTFTLSRYSLSRSALFLSSVVSESKKSLSEFTESFKKSPFTVLQAIESDKKSF